MNDMIRISSTESGKEVGRYQDVALTQPVVVTRNGRDRTVMISADEYRRLKRRDRAVFAAGEAPEDIIEAVRVPTAITASIRRPSREAPRSTKRSGYCRGCR